MARRIRFLVVAAQLVLASSLAACGDDDGGAGADASTADASADTPDAAADAAADGAPAEFTLTSTAFNDGDLIPMQYTCNGANISPPLAWSGAPAGTQSFAFVFNDLTFSFLHSAAWDIPLSRTSFPEDVSKVFEPFGSGDMKQADSFVGVPGWAGPCPPNLHTYQFTIYALDVASLPALDENSTLQQVVNAAEAAAIDTATLDIMYEQP